MLTIVETPEFLSSTKKLIGEHELDSLKTLLAGNPLAGDVIEGTGGFRKIRVARADGGKSGGFRVIYYFYNETIPLFLFLAYAKANQGTLTRAQKNALRNIADTLASY